MSTSLNFKGEVSSLTDARAVPEKEWAELRSMIADVGSTDAPVLEKAELFIAQAEWLSGSLFSVQTEVAQTKFNFAINLRRFNSALFGKRSEK